MNPRFILSLIGASTLVASLALAAPAPKVDVCHPAGKSGQVLTLNVNANSLGGHLGHGDWLPATFFDDLDGDGYGDDGSAFEACVQPASTSTIGGDCDDDAGTTQPGAEEVCDDGVDNNCNDEIDEDCVGDDPGICSSLLGTDLGSTPDWTGDCGAIGGTEYGGHCYYVDAGWALWADGRATCAAAGGHLVTIGSAGENALVTSFGLRAFVGLCDADVEGVYTWITGEPVTYTNWGSGEPNNYGNEDTTELLHGGQWNDIWSWNDPWVQGFICEFE